MPSIIVPGVIYPGIQMSALSQAKAVIQLPKVTYNALYSIISLDTDEDSNFGGYAPSDSSGSDPKVYLRKSFGGTGEEQYCGSFGSKICPVKKSLMNSQLDIFITCPTYCRFSLKVTTV